MCDDLEQAIYITEHVLGLVFVGLLLAVLCWMMVDGYRESAQLERAIRESQKPSCDTMAITGTLPISIDGFMRTTYGVGATVIVTDVAGMTLCFTNTQGVEIRTR